MHDAGVRPVPVLFGQNAAMSLVRGAGVDDQRQAGFARCGYVDAQGLLLNFSTFRRVVIIQTGFADADKFRML